MNLLKALKWNDISLMIPTCKNNNVDVLFGVLKLVWDTQIAVNIFFFQAT